LHILRKGLRGAILTLSSIGPLAYGRHTNVFFRARKPIITWLTIQQVDTPHLFQAGAGRTHIVIVRAIVGDGPLDTEVLNTDIPEETMVSCFTWSAIRGGMRTPALSIASVEGARVFVITRDFKVGAFSV